MADGKSDEDPVEDAARAITEGVAVGDFVARPVVSLSTDDHLDTNENRERARQADDDAHAAQQAGVLAPALHPAAPPAPEHTALDDALDDARARLAGGGTADMPMILHDPVTGEPVRGN